MGENLEMKTFLKWYILTIILNFPWKPKSQKERKEVCIVSLLQYWINIRQKCLLGYIDPFVFGSGVSIINYWSFLKAYPKFQLEIWTVTAWIFSDSLVNTISFPIQIWKSIISKIKANNVEQMHKNYKLWHNLSNFGRIRA